MEKSGFAVLVAVFLSSSVVTMPNHNAVLISGYEASATQTPPGIFPSIGEPAWNDLYFWTDIFLMWELMYDTSFGQFYYYAPRNPDGDHIWVFYGPDSTGKDFESPLLSTRYDPWTQHGIDDITDYGHFKKDIMMIFDSLAHGSESMGIDPMTSQDRLFCLVLSHGGSRRIYVQNYDDWIYDSVFATAVDQISCKDRVFWIESCKNGGLLDDLESPSTVILTACKNTEDAEPCDDIRQWDTTWQACTLYGQVDTVWWNYVELGSEKEMHFYFHGDTVDTIYQEHGEFDFHYMNALRGETPVGQARAADLNGDSLVSMEEVYCYVKEMDSWQYHRYCEFKGGKWCCSTLEHPQYSDPDSIGDTLLLDGMPPALAGFQDTCECGNPLTHVVLNWDDNVEPDFVAYKVYRNGVMVDSSDGSRYLDTNVVDSVYTYRRTAFDRIGNEESVTDAFSLICGDVNADARITIADATYITSYIYRGGPPPHCPPEPVYRCCCDVNLDDGCTIADATYIVAYIYRDGPPPCEPGDRSSSEEYAQVGLSISETDHDVTELSVLAEFDVPIAAVHLEVNYDPQTIQMLDPVVTPRSHGLQLFYDLSLNPGRVIFGMLDLQGQFCLKPGEGSILTLRVRGKYGKPDLKSLLLKKGVFVDMDSKTLNTEILDGGTPSGGPQSVAHSVGSRLSFTLSQNYPNPFPLATTIKYVVPLSSPITLSIYDIGGQEVRRLVDGSQATGSHSVHWDGTTDRGQHVSAGVYFYKLTAGDFTRVKKMVLLR